MLIFVDALRALAHALVSPSTLVQREALRGISFLAADDQLRIVIVEGPLKQVIRIFVDPSTEPELKNIAEQVFIHLGFNNGKRDLQMVANDSELLSDWFYMKRSMRPQALAHDLCRHWVDALFYGEEMAERRARKQFILAELSRSDTIVPDDADSLSLRLPDGLAIDVRDTLDLPGLNLIRDMMVKLMSTSSSNNVTAGGLYWGPAKGTMGTHSELRDALHQQFVILFDSWQTLNRIYVMERRRGGRRVASDTPPTLRHSSSGGTPTFLSPPQSGHKKRTGRLIADTLFGYFLVHCSSRTAAQQIIDEEEQERAEKEHEMDRDLMGPLYAVPSISSEFQSPPHSKPSHHNHRSTSSSSHVQTPRGPEIKPIRRSVSTTITDAKLKPCEDLAPMVVELLDIIFPSKLLQMHILDLISCGMLCANPSSHGGDYVIPTPKPFRALLLPPREYLSFQREGRIVERILEDIKTRGIISEKPTFHYNANSLSFGKPADGYVVKGSDDDASSVLWAISFRDSYFGGDFFATFLNTLHNCPSLSSINFVSKKPAVDEKLGYLAGNVPPTVRFMTFESTLSSDSLEIMCVLLRTQNASWQRSQNGTSQTTGSKVLSDSDERQRGLLGLGIRVHTLSDEDIHHLVELLDPSGDACIFPQTEVPKSASSSYRYTSPKAQSGGYQTTSPVSGSSPLVAEASVVSSSAFVNGSMPATPVPVAQAVPTIRLPESSPKPAMKNGLKYLDLSDNKLSDNHCAEILKAAAVGPLEGLELGGNSIKQGLYFVSALQAVHEIPLCLKHLGLSGCGLQQQSFCGILSALIHGKYSSLTSLDFSSNSLHHSPEVKVHLTEFLKQNKTCRILDLSDNLFNNDTVRAIYVGLVQNALSVLLILKMTPNNSINSSSVELVREKLAANRLHYVNYKTANASNSFRHSMAANSSDSAKEVAASAAAERDRSTTDVASLLNNEPSSAPTLRKETSESTSSVENDSDANRIVIKRSTSDASFGRARATSRDDARITLNTARVGGVVLAGVAEVDVLASPVANPDAVSGMGGRSRSGSLIEGNSSGSNRRAGSGSGSLVRDAAAVALAALESHDGASSAPKRHGSDSGSSVKEAASAAVAALGSSGDVSDRNGKAGNIEKDFQASATPVVEAVAVVSAYPVDVSEGSAEGSSAVVAQSSPFNKENAVDEESGITASLSHNVLCVLFSAPLAWRDYLGNLRPIEMLNFKNERDTLWQVFREAQRDIGLHFNFATTERLRTAVTLGCRALHFSGHGHPEWLNFEDGKSGLQLVTVETLRNLCGAGVSKLDFVFVSACHSKNTGEAFAAAGVPHVVCVSIDAQLLDTAATTFTRAFYLSLAVGNTVRQSFDIGRQAVVASPTVPNSSSERDKFLLLPEGALHDKPVFVSQRVTKWPTVNNVLRGLVSAPPDHLPDTPEDFEGREVDMYNIITLLQKRALVTVTGERGMGKSAVVIAVMRYLAERNVFEHGAIYVRLTGITTYEGFMMAFQRALATSTPLILQRLSAHNISIRENGAAENSSVSTQSVESAKRDMLFTQEDLLISAVSSLNLLIVMDHVDDILANSEVSAFFKIFLGRLLDGRSKRIKASAHYV